MPKKSADGAKFLAHPVYLDVPMMVSFLATLDDGVAYTSEVAERLASTKEGEGSAALKGGIPSLAQWLGLSLTAEGKYQRRSASDESVEAKLVREHTSASLFNILRQRLQVIEGMKALMPGEDLSNVQVGDLVEVRGAITGDPLRKVLALMSAIAPYFGWDLDGEAKPAAKRRRPPSSRKKNTQPAAQPDEQSDDLEAFDFFRILKADVAKSSVLDLTMTLDDGRHVVLAASSEYMTEATEQHMLAGSFTALGKVTQVLEPGEEVSLLRRTVFSVLEATGESSAEEAFESLSDAMPGMDFSNLAITGPGLQVLPLAIYV